MPLGRRTALAAAIVASALVTIAFAPAPAQAYPQWQFTSGASRCNQCHYGPGGGGLITSFGRDANSEDLSTFGGDGALLHGIVSPPAWLALGGDVRGAFVSHAIQDPEGTHYAVFPMQADLQARVAPGAGFSVYASGGFRGQARQPDDPVPSQNYQPINSSRLISREHYVMWQPEVLGPYVRAGRFYAPFGLRLAEHVTYVRRDLGFNLLQESYNLSGGFVSAESELHLTAFAPDFVRHIGSEDKGFAGYYEHRLFDDQAAIAAQSKIAFGPGLTRLVFGSVGKVFIAPARLLLLGEVNVVQLMFDSAAVGGRSQLIAAAGFAVLPARGLVVTLLGERNQTDIAVRDSALSAATLLVNWFPFAHGEVQVMGRLQSPSGGETAKTLLMQLHYFL